MLLHEPETPPGAVSAPPLDRDTPAGAAPPLHRDTPPTAGYATSMCIATLTDSDTVTLPVPAVTH